MQEARCIMKCRRIGLDTPALLMVDTESSRIFMERINGATVKQRLNELYDSDAETFSPEALQISKAVGAAVAKMHNADLIHGDLTTSNIMLRSQKFTPQEGVVLIDFGLGSQSNMNEDKAVDLYVLERSLTSTHANSSPLADEILREYKKICRRSDAVMQKLANVRARGRKRECFG